MVEYRDLPAECLESLDVALAEYGMTNRELAETARENVTTILTANERMRECRELESNGPSE